jgi:glycosyltransferase involved in cell wall biosynthesis
VGESSPTISVVIPTLNAADDIRNCMESLQSQSFRCFDVQVIDGGSSDETVERAKSYAGLIGVELSCLSVPGSTVYEAMNFGVQRARGEWLYFLGADDLIHDDSVFEDVVKRVSLADADVIYGDVLLKKDGSRYGGEFSLDRLLFECNICHQAIFYRKEVFDRIGDFSNRYPIWADWDLNIRCFKNKFLRPRWIDRIIARYNDTSGLSRNEDPIFSKELPVIATRERSREVNSLKSARSFLIGKALFGWLD